MMDPSDIKTPKDLEAFLNDWPEEGGPGGLSRQQAATWIAHRAAMRVLPVFWEWVTRSEKARERGLTALPILRALLISGVAARMPTPDLSVGAARAARAADDAANTAASAATDATFNAAARAATETTFNAAAAARASFATTAVSAAVRAAIARATIAADTLKVLRADAAFLAASKDLAQTPLWHDRANPLEELWAGLKRTLPTGGSDETARGAAPADWSFWIKWYEDALAGREPDWEMLEEIALIPSETWDQGPLVVNPLINDIWARHLRNATWNAEQISENPETGLLQVTPASALPDAPRQNIQTKLADITDTFAGQGGPNGPYTELEPEVALVRKAAAISNPQPMRLYDLCRRASRRAQMRAVRGDCPKDDPLVADFVEQLDEAAFDIMSANADVAAVVSARAQFRMQQAVPEAGQVLREAAEQIAAHAEPELADELVDDADRALDESQPDDLRKDALYVTASRMVRIYRGVRVALKEIHDVSKDVAGISKNLAIALASYPALQAAVRYLLSLF